MVLILTKNDVVSVLKMKECIEVVEQAFSELAKGTAVMPLRTSISASDGLLLYMPAFLKESGALACKVVSVYKNNPINYNLPTTIGKVLLQNPLTGEVICIMDGGYLTAVRTGAASGVATRYLVKKKKEYTVSVFGAGVQAKMQLWAVAEVVNVSKAWVYDISEEAAGRFVSEMSEKLGIPVHSTKKIEDMLENDIICTATSSSVPLFDGNLLKNGTHINGIGSHSPNARELDTVTIARSKFVGDSKDACFKEAGDLLIPISEKVITVEHFYAELGEVIIGKKEGRCSDDEITLFKSNGLAIQDAAAALLVYQKAIKKGIGQMIEI